MEQTALGLLAAICDGEVEALAYEVQAARSYLRSEAESARNGIFFASLKP